MQDIARSKIKKFIVGDKVFYNNVSALSYFSKNSEKKLYFDPGYNFIYDFTQWSIEPPKSIEEYFSDHVKNISEKYNDIYLLYSGGTDSHTMLKSFINEKVKNLTLIHVPNASYEIDKKHKNPRNELHIDPIIKDLLSKYKEKLEELNYTIKIVPPHRYSANIDEYSNILSSGNFGDYNTDISSGEYNWVDNASENAQIWVPQNSYKRSCVVAGREKPQITLIHNETFWAWQTHSSHSMDIYIKSEKDNLDVIDFYYSDIIPELQIKLSWLKIKALEKIIWINDLPLTKKTVEDLQSHSSKYYTFINSAMGYEALNKYLNSNLNKLIISEKVKIENTQIISMYKNFRKKNNIENLINEYYIDVSSNIRKDFLSDNNKIAAIKSLAVPIKKVDIKN